MSGKGDAPRNCFTQQFRDNWDRIFGGEGKSTDSGTPHCCDDAETVQPCVQDGGSTPPTSNNPGFANSERVC